MNVATNGHTTEQAAGFLPPEWAPQEAVMLTWPRRGGDFADSLQRVERCFTKIACTIARFEPIWINVDEAADQLRHRLLGEGIPANRLRLHEVPNDDVWARDHGPITVLRGHQRIHLNFCFNGWGGKFPAQRDDALTGRLARIGAWNAPVEPVDLVLEGGAVEVDGAGTLLTTERCLLAPTRNPNLTRDAIEKRLKILLGVSRILWLRHGVLLGDDTDGHVDTLARFCSPRTIAFQSCSNPRDAHYPELRALAEELGALRDLQGEPYQLVALPLPAPVTAVDGRRLPAGYANFLIVNGAVLVPTYGDPCDEVAQALLRPHFPDRELVGIDCRALVEQNGSLHCVTMQIPASTEAQDNE